SSTSPIGIAVRRSARPIRISSTSPNSSPPIGRGHTYIGRPGAWDGRAANMRPSVINRPRITSAKHPNSRPIRRKKRPRMRYGGGPVGGQGSPSGHQEGRPRATCRPLLIYSPSALSTPRHRVHTATGKPSSIRELVAEPVDREDVAWLARVRLQLTANVLDVG